MGIKDRRTKILLALYLLSNESFQRISFKAEILTLFDLTLNRSTIATFENLVEEGLILGDIENNIPSYTLSDEGFKCVCLIFPSFRFQKESWDGFFRILSYEIPEKKRELRDKLRREVASWGLGPWHRSFWITAHPILPALRRLVSDKEEEQYVQAFESTHVFGNQEILVDKVWEVKAVESAYRSLFKKWHATLSVEKEKNLKMKLVLADYVDVLKIDPGLPKQLVGENWIGYEAVTLFREIRDILLSNTS